jgi:hypothetical protein
MSFTKFKNDYLEIVNGDGFKSTKEVVDFMIDNYMSAIDGIGTIVWVDPTGELLQPAIDVMKEALEVIFDQQKGPEAMEASLSLAISSLWLLGGLPGLYSTVLGGHVPGKTSGNIPAQANSAEEFIDGVISMFDEIHNGLSFGHATSPPILGSAAIVVP